MDKKHALRQQLIDAVGSLGYPGELGALIADSLGSENTMTRMLAYLRAAKPGSEEEIVDEMLAIISDRDRWRDKKINEFYNRKYNEYLWFYRDQDDE